MFFPVTHYRTVEGNSDHSEWPAGDRAQSALGLSALA